MGLLKNKIFMKKLINYSLLFFVGILFISCSKDSSSPSVVGKWHFTANGAKGTGSTIVWTLNQENACELQSYSEFVSNGTLLDQYYSTDLTTGACVLYVNPTPNLSSTTWVRSGDDIIITYSDFSVTPTNVDTYKSRIVSLTDSEIITQNYDFNTNTTLIDSYSKAARR